MLIAASPHRRHPVPSRTGTTHPQQPTQGVDGRSSSSHFRTKSILQGHAVPQNRGTGEKQESKCRETLADSFCTGTIGIRQSSAIAFPAQIRYAPVKMNEKRRARAYPSSPRTNARRRERPPASCPFTTSAATGSREDSAPAFYGYTAGFCPNRGAAPLGFSRWNNSVKSSF